MLPVNHLPQSIPTLTDETSVAAQAEMDSNGLAADIPQATALVTLLQMIGKFILSFVPKVILTKRPGGSLGGSIGGALLTNGLRTYLPSDLPPSTITSLLQSVETIWTLSGDVQEAVIGAYAKALDDVFVIGVAAGGLGLVFALLCSDIK
jgi:hypothetical protein